MHIQNIDENLSMNISDTSGVSLQVSDVDTSLEMNIDTNDVVNLNIINEEGNIGMEVETSGSKIEGTTDHSKLQNLDYERSGHTGFQPKGNYVEDKNYIHTDNNFTDAQKTKLESLNNYDDTFIKESVSSNTSQINTLKTSVDNLDENKADKTEIPDVSNFITKEVDDLTNYYLKSEIEQFSSNITQQLGNKADKSEIPSLEGYATEEWVKEQDYMPIPDFREYINYFHYDKTQVDEKFNDYYNKEEIDTKLEDLPTGGTELTGGDNIVIENNAINVYTNTGYKVIDKDIKLQPITNSVTTGTNKMVYVDDKEIIIIYDGTNKIRRSENGIDFNVITLPCACKDMVYNPDAKRLYGTDGTNNFIWSEDNGLTWGITNTSFAKNTDYLSIGYGSGCKAIHKSTKRVENLTFNESTGSFSLNSSITSSIIPEYLAMVNQTQFVWCNSTGTFKYGAGSQEGNFASLSGVSVNLLKRVNNITMLGLKNNNKMYLLEPANSITAYKWTEYSLPDICTLNDIIFNPYDETYYLFTNINTYYKTKDFANPDSFESVDKNGLRGIQGYFTLMGIQTTTSNHNELFLAPTTTTLENKAQEWDRGLNKDLWIGKGLKENEIKKVDVITTGGSLGVNDNGLFLIGIEEWHLPENIVESIYVAKAELIPNFDPYEIESWFWEHGYPSEENYKATKLIFNQAGSFYDQATWETEYVVEQYEYGYIYADSSGSLCKYVKLGNLSCFFNKGE